jgi:GNAT superfamily N-acetyltransferase
MKGSISVEFVNRATSARVRGEIRQTYEEDLLSWASWRYSDSDEDKNWDWAALYSECKNSRGRYECYSAIAQDELHGLVILDLKTKQNRSGVSITVDYLATNPTNRHQNSGLKNVGIALIVVAILRAYESGCRGRLWLEALPGACGFYENLGFRRQRHISPEGNATYVLDSGGAKSLLDEIKTRGIVNL